MGGAQYRWGDASEVELDGSVGSARLMWGVRRLSHVRKKKWSSH
jgi:hypothetical protein